MDGQVALDRETAMKHRIRNEFDAVPGTRENWLTHSFEASSIADVETASLVHVDIDETIKRIQAEVDRHTPRAVEDIADQEPCVAPSDPATK